MSATPAVLRPFTVSFDRAQEADADRFAVSLLRRLEPRQPGACVALVYVLALQYLLAFRLDWFPINGYEGGWAAVKYLGLPWLIQLLLLMGPGWQLVRDRRRGVEVLLVHVHGILGIKHRGKAVVLLVRETDWLPSPFHGRCYGCGPQLR